MPINRRLSRQRVPPLLNTPKLAALVRDKIISINVFHSIRTGIIFLGLPLPLFLGGSVVARWSTTFLFGGGEDTGGAGTTWTRTSPPTSRLIYYKGEQIKPIDVLTDLVPAWWHVALLRGDHCGRNGRISRFLGLVHVDLLRRPFGLLVPKGSAAA